MVIASVGDETGGRTLEMAAIMLLLAGSGGWIAGKLWMLSGAIGESQAWGRRGPFALASFGVLVQHWSRVQLPQPVTLVCALLVLGGTALLLLH